MDIIPHHPSHTKAKEYRGAILVCSLHSGLSLIYRTVILRHLEEQHCHFEKGLKICLAMVSAYLSFFLWPCRRGRDSCSGHWDPGAV